MTGSAGPRIVGPASAMVYRCLNRAGEVIYVGRTSALRPRMARHKVASSWWSEVAELHHGLYEPADDAVRRELELIVALQPKHNRAGKDGGDNVAIAREASLRARRDRAVTP